MPHDLRPLQSRETVLANARLVLETETVAGCLLVRDGRIAAVDTGTTVPRGAEDLDGDLLSPGLIELHTDNLERHLEPRPGVVWPQASAILAHDAELAGCGVTTVFDALRVGSLVDAGKVGYGKYARPIATAITAMAGDGLLRLRHGIHLRAEVCSETLEGELAEFHEGDGVGIVSVMDHTPGQRQFTDIARQRTYAVGRRGLTDDEFEAHVAAMCALSARVAPRHEAAIVAAARRLGATLASHDDTTEAHVAASATHGARIAEFPTTARRRPRLPRRRHRRHRRRPQPPPRRLALRQRRRPHPRRRRPARHPLLRLRPGEPPRRRRRPRPRGRRPRPRPAHRHRRPGRRRRSRRPRPPRARPRRRPPARPPDAELAIPAGVWVAGRRVA